MVLESRNSVVAFFNLGFLFINSFTSDYNWKWLFKLIEQTHYFQTCHWDHLFKCMHEMLFHSRDVLLFLSLI